MISLSSYASSPYDYALSTSATSSSTAVPQQAVSSTSTGSSGWQDDTVHISEAAQAKLLYKQGESVNVIASSLGTTSNAINNDLGITLQKEIEQTLESTLKV